VQRTSAARRSMDQHALTTLLPLAVAVLVVFRFAFRELRERTVTLPGIWIRPAIIVLLTVYLVTLTTGIDSRDDGIMLICLGVGALLGAVTGLAIVRNTTFAPAEKKNAVRGSRVTALVAVAFTIIAAAFQREIGRHAPAVT
jgi:hypothetical protein